MEKISRRWGYHDNGKNNFMGKIDELRLYDTALNTEQIHILFKEVFEMHQAKVHDEAVLKRKPKSKQSAQFPAGTVID